MKDVIFYVSLFFLVTNYNSLSHAGSKVGLHQTGHSPRTLNFISKLSI